MKTAQANFVGKILNNKQVINEFAIKEVSCLGNHIR